jgi:hypothetical protein
MKPKGCQSEPRDVPKHPLRNRLETFREKGTKLGSLFDQRSMRKQSNNHQTNDCEQNMICLPNGCQHETKFGAKTHQSSMPKQVAKQIVKNIKIHKFMMCKNMKIHYKNNVL